MRPLLERTLSTAGLHHRSKRKMSHTHTTLPPSYTMHRQMKCSMCRGLGRPVEEVSGNLFCACTRVTSGSGAFPFCFPTQTHPEWEHAALAGAHSQHSGPSPPQQKKEESYSHHPPSIVHDAQTGEISPFDLVLFAHRFPSTSKKLSYHRVLVWHPSRPS